MTSREIRRAFLEYFIALDHRAVASSPLVLPQDPTLLFANAGMNQFKDVFTGRERRDYQRAVTVQKCLRVSGKHNDLETVGRTPRHHTLFEMLGNFSFGDYFKRDAIGFAWELVTEVLGLPPERLWVTVFGGNERFDGDDEAARTWLDEIGIPPGRLLRLGERDNFWSMGDTGPCGPCSELHYDLGEDLTSVEGPATPETDTRRFVEIWNLVFMEFDRGADGSVVELPAKSVDTGMGLERIAAVLQGHRSNFETDLFRPLVDAAAERAGKRWGADPADDFSLRVIADHTRALCFLVADGVVPANDKRGYVLRRLLRRAIRHGRKLGIDGPFLHEVSPAVIDGLGDVYPELLASREAIIEVGRREEERFAETLATGLDLFEESLARAAAAGGPARLPGPELFRLYDTYGFPLELAQDIAAERGVVLDEAGFEAEMARQRARAQASWKSGARPDVASGYDALSAKPPTRFEGYTRLRLDDAEVLALLDREGRPVPRLTEGESGAVLLDATPFYAEAGGQVGDTGWLVGPALRVDVTGAHRPLATLCVHAVCVGAGTIEVGMHLTAEVDGERRQAVRRNHTATHLLHAALREVVGTHVKQAGSLVAEDRLRFDFSHFAGLSDRALADIESLVNRKVLEDLPVETAPMELEAALRSGAMALFGEKYGDRVRVVSIGEFSRELCGGTHCARSGEVGLVKLVGERGIASGTRRVEAVTGEASLARFRRDHAIVRGLEEQLLVQADRLREEIARRLEAGRSLQREVETLRVAAERERLAGADGAPQDVGGVRLVARRVDGLGPQEMRELADGLRQKLGSGVVVLGRAEATKASLLVAVTPDLAHRLPAGDLVRALGRIIGGGGGGRPDLAEAGGKDPARLDDALAAAAAEVARRMEARE
jgi:alanyl-tRNA synthetase